MFEVYLYNFYFWDICLGVKMCIKHDKDWNSVSWKLLKPLAFPELGLYWVSPKWYSIKFPNIDEENLHFLKLYTLYLHAVSNPKLYSVSNCISDSYTYLEPFSHEFILRWNLFIIRSWLWTILNNSVTRQILLFFIILFRPNLRLH